MLVLGVLLILGSVFLGFISRGIITSGRAQNRSIATDLAEAGVRFAHSQLMDSDLGADWRPPISALVNPRDPDFDFLKANGPDGLGPYSRINMANGRALIRVRYSPSDSNVFSGSPTGNLRTPGRARGYLIIEAVGRSGQFSTSDPTTVTNRERAQERKLIAFASIGLIDQARFITNKFDVSRPAELGIPANLGAAMGNVPVDNLDLQLGSQGFLYTQLGAPTLNPVIYGGGIRVNGDLVVHGQVDANLNTYLGDLWLISGGIVGADSNATLRLHVADYNKNTNQYVTRGLISLTNASNPSLSSRGNFSTFDVLRDGMMGVDPNGVERGVRRLDPPSLLRTDPQTGLTRYVELTRESGALGPNGNTGLYGYGRGVFVNNHTDRQIRPDEGGRADLGTAENLVYDWLTPNNGGANTGWKGPFYIPTGAFMELNPDGFTIVLNSQSLDPTQRTWKLPDGTDTGTATIRYRIGNVNGLPYIVNSFTPGVNISGALTGADYAKGQPFNGVVYFDGNVRIRGVIPTDIQMTVVSGATIYIEGSITKGVVGNDFTGSPGQLLNGRPSHSMLMLMAKEYAAVNTTQFVGSAAGQNIDVKDGDTLSAVRVPASSGGFSLKFEPLLNPDSYLMPLSAAKGDDPSTFTAFSTTYAMQQETAGSPSSILQNLLLVHSMDDGGGAAPASFISADVNFGVDNLTTAHTNDWNYLFPLNAQYGWETGTPNGAEPYQGSVWAEPNHNPGFSIVYGLGGQPWQRFAKFESTAFPFVDPSFTYSIPRVELDGQDTSLPGSMVLQMQTTNDLSIRANNQFGAATADYLLGRAAIVPMDVRIEASIYAEEGSFFVIPGPSYNSNPNDRRDAYLAQVAKYEGAPFNLPPNQARDAADSDRLANFGTFPLAPFYGEPLDVKINVMGSVSENMPPPMSQQGQWLKSWGWIPRFQGAARTTIGANQVDLEIPIQHIPGVQAGATNPAYANYVPNIVITYDPALATGRSYGFTNPDQYGAANPYLRVDASGRALPPLPRLPVSPTLSYFGEVNP